VVDPVAAAPVARLAGRVPEARGAAGRRDGALDPDRLGRGAEGRRGEDTL